MAKRLGASAGCCSALHGRVAGRRLVHHASSSTTLPQPGQPRLDPSEVRLYDQTDRRLRDFVYAFDFDGRSFTLVGTPSLHFIQNYFFCYLN